MVYFLRLAGQSVPQGRFYKDKDNLMKQTTDIKTLELKLPYNPRRWQEEDDALYAEALTLAAPMLEEHVRSLKDVVFYTEGCNVPGKKFPVRILERLARTLADAGWFPELVQKCRLVVHDRPCLNKDHGRDLFYRNGDVRSF